MEYGLFGGKLAHSYSPMIHEMLADYRYELCACTPEEMERRLKDRDFRGMNVTIPYKKLAFLHCDTLSQEARRLESVNTLLVEESGALHGENTDWLGFRSMVERSGISPKGRKAAVLGTGGSGRTAADVLGQMGAREVLPVSRSGPVDYACLYEKHDDVEILINATPVGMYPGNGLSPVDLSMFPRCIGVLDLIYNPYRTELLLQAKDRGIPHANGLWMLVAQAHRAAELFTGEPIDEERIGHIHAHIRRITENIVLIGMPGSGKSRIGEELARRMGRKFVDLDTELERRAGRSIPEIFAREGEAAFRDMESELLKEIGKEKALVLATGGGAVLRESNMRALLQNGEGFFIERPLAQLEQSGRPLSTGMEALERMYAVRLPLYEKYSKRTIQNAGSIADAAKAIEEGFYASVGD